MQRARVIGRVVATTKHPSMVGYRLLIAAFVGPAGTIDGDPVIVVDTLGAGPGTTVIVTSDGRTARQLIGTDTTPVRYTTVGLEDERGG